MLGWFEQRAAGFEPGLPKGPSCCCTAHVKSSSRQTTAKSAVEQRKLLVLVP